MTEDPWVWVTDVYSGHARPMTRDAISLDPDRYRLNEAHPVRDDEGRLLPVRFRTSLSDLMDDAAVVSADTERAYVASLNPTEATEAHTTEAKEAM